ncbi:MAG: MraZ protein [Parcubacteria group bacterium Athens1014_10]|nr:MAG: MraZ protein [Parcubacteria group bacterium Athens1014_10]TSD05985.1 MAG: MraZ protein [Parcubacteria group bacterium Athens0714_12]
MFIGEYHHNIDEKGRLAVPIKFRNQLEKGAVVTKGLDNCLFLYTQSEWEKLADKLAKLPINKSNSRGFARFMLAGAMDIEIDKQGRVILPDYLRKFAGIKKKAVIAGLYNRLEIWDEEKWEKYKQGAEEESENIAETLGEMNA